MARKNENREEMQARYPMTVSQEVYDAWQIFRRMNDSTKISAYIGKTGRAACSRPTIDKALNYGHTKDPILANLITKFFENRVESEKEGGANLIKKATGE